MLTIRKEQVAVFRAWMRRDFLNRMLRHLEVAFPRQCEALGEEQVRTLIEAGLQRCARYGIYAERNVALFIDLMLALGPDFDSRRDFAWMSAILKHSQRPERIKMDMIYARIKRQLPEVSLPELVL